jgi:short-subunit dehydrogenase
MSPTATLELRSPRLGQTRRIICGAKRLAVRESSLHLIDRDEARLAAVVDRIARDNPAVTARVTVFDLEAIENLSELAEDVIKDGFPPFW